MGDSIPFYKLEKRLEKLKKLEKMKILSSLGIFAIVSHAINLTPTLDYPASFSEYNTDYTYDEGFNDFIDNFIENMIDQVIAQKRIKPIQNGETAQDTLFSPEDFQEIYSEVVKSMENIISDTNKVMVKRGGQLKLGSKGRNSARNVPKRRFFKSR